MLYSAIFACRVHSLKNKQQRPVILRVELVLQFRGSKDFLLQGLLRMLLRFQVARISRIEIFQPKMLPALNPKRVGKLASLHQCAPWSQIHPNDSNFLENCQDCTQILETPLCALSGSPLRSRRFSLLFPALPKQAAKHSRAVLLCIISSRFVEQGVLDEGSHYCRRVAADFGRTLVHCSGSASGKAWRQDRRRQIQRPD